MSFDTSASICNPHPLKDVRHFQHPCESTLTLFQALPQGNCCPDFYHHRLFVPVSCKWSHTICSLSCLAFVTQVNVFVIHLCCWVDVVCASLWLKNIPLYENVTVRLFVLLVMDIWAVFTFINKATTNTHVEVFVHTSVFVSLGYMWPRSGIAGSYGKRTFNFRRHRWMVFQSGGSYVFWNKNTVDSFFFRVVPGDA